MPQLICYDIEHNGLRTKLAQLILDYGLERINFSVYLGSLDSSSLTELETKLQALIQQRGQDRDSLIVLPVTAAQIHAMRVYGQNGLDPGEITGDKSTLIL